MFRALILFWVLTTCPVAFGDYLVIIGEGGEVTGVKHFGYMVTVGTTDVSVSVTGFVVPDDGGQASGEYGKLFYPVHYDYDRRAYAFFEGMHPAREAIAKTDVQSFILDQILKGSDDPGGSTHNYLASLTFAEFLAQLKSGVIDPVDYISDIQTYRKEFSNGHWDPRYWTHPTRGIDDYLILQQSKVERMDRKYADTLHAGVEQWFYWADYGDHYALVDFYETFQFRFISQHHHTTENKNAVGEVTTYDHGNNDAFEGRKHRTRTLVKSSTLSTVDLSGRLEESWVKDYHVRVGAQGEGSVPVVAFLFDSVNYDWPQSERQVFVALREDFSEANKGKIQIFLVNQRSLLIPKDAHLSPAKAPAEHLKHLRSRRVFKIARPKGQSPDEAYENIKASIQNRHTKRESWFKSHPVSKPEYGEGFMISCALAFRGKTIPAMRRFIHGY